ncbi:MAG: hypothetical protein ACPGUU_03295 [Flavobacteriaceae bacterium]
MYTLTVQNNYVYDVGSSNGVTISKGKNHVFNNQGSLYLNVPGMYDINFIDIADKKIDGYPEPKQTWGVLVRVNATEAYYRYEGGGVLNATIDSHGGLSLGTTNGNIIHISLPELTLI